MEAELLPRKLAAILYADVAGYSRLTGEDEDATHRRLSDYLDEITVTIERHRDDIYGDGVNVAARLESLAVILAG
ncbi:MAG: hypothetical protein V3U60_17430 [Gammaproteobacteria bacterium]